MRIATPATLATTLAILLTCTRLAHAQDSAPPTVPSNLVATAVSPNMVQLTWNPSVDNVRVAGYLIYLIDANDNWTTLATVTGTTFRHFGLQPNTQYAYRVSAFDGVPNHSQWTNHGIPALSVTTPLWDSQNPTTPANLVATVASPTQINLSWNPATDNVGVMGYIVYQNDVALAHTTTTSFQHAGLTPGTSYNYRVSAYDRVENNGAWTANPVYATTAATDTQAPSVPASLTATAVSSTQVNLSWSPSTDNLSVAGYIVYINDNWQNPFIVTSSTSFQHILATPGTTYTYRVSAFDGVPNHSPWSTTAASATTPASDAFTPSATFTSSLDEFPNPERGLSQIIPESVSDMWKEAAYTHSNEGYVVKGNSFRLMTHRQLLPNTDVLDSTLIYNLNKGANWHRTVGTKMAISFSYDNNEGGSAIIPPLSRIVSHIAQLEGFFKANADVITAVHAGFLGVYGEWAFWQGGAVPSASDRSAVRDALYAAVPRETPIGFRVPMDLSAWYPTPLTAQQSLYTFNNQARSGMHNDCWLYSDTDLGTYYVQGQNNGRTLSNAMRAYHAAISEWTTTGGEHCDTTDYDTSTNPPTSQLCSYALEDGPRYHWRYRRDELGSGASPFNAIFESLGCYAQIKRSLGYRYQLDAISHPATVARGNTISIAVDMRNVGWARISTPRQLVVTLRNRTDGSLISGAAGDMRFIPSQATSSTRLVVRVAVPANASTGTYDVYLSMPDVSPGTKSNPLHAIRFANAEVAGSGQGWETANARFKAGTTLTVQ